MEKFIKYFKSFGAIGGFIANAISLVCTNWVLTLSTAMAIITGLSDWATSVIQNKNIQSAGWIFVISLWTMLGLTILRDRKTVKIVKIDHEYAYSLIVDGGWQIAFDSESDDAVLQLGLQWRNVGAGPIRVKVEEFRILIGNQTVPDPDVAPEMTFAKLACKGIRSGAFNKNIIQPRAEGTVSVKLIYGPPEGEFIRRYKLKLKIHMKFKESEFVGISEECISETDKPIGDLD